MQMTTETEYSARFPADPLHTVFSEVLRVHFLEPLLQGLDQLPARIEVRPLLKQGVPLSSCIPDDLPNIARGCDNFLELGDYCQTVEKRIEFRCQSQGLRRRSTAGAAATDDATSELAEWFEFEIGVGILPVAGERGTSSPS